MVSMIAARLLPTFSFVAPRDAKRSKRVAAILDQIATALRPGNRLALAIAAILGGFIPAASYVVAHYEVAMSPAKWILVLAGLAYSGLTVFEWANIAFRSVLKSAGFVVLLEGISTFASTEALSLTAVSCLVFINAVATSTNLINDRKESRACARAGTSRGRSAKGQPRGRSDGRGRPAA
jgi:hypothetical protein